MTRQLVRHVLPFCCGDGLRRACVSCGFEWLHTVCLLSLESSALLLVSIALILVEPIPLVNLSSL